MHNMLIYGNLLSFKILQPEKILHKFKKFSSYRNPYPWQLSIIRITEIDTNLTEFLKYNT